MKLKALSILLISIWCGTLLQAQDKSNRGKEFWLAYGFDYSFTNESPPNSQELAIYIGWKLHGKKGGLVAGILFVFPSMLVLLALSIIYVTFGNLPWIYAMFNGLKPAVIAIILIALYKDPVEHFIRAGALFIYCTRRMILPV